MSSDKFGIGIDFDLGDGERVLAGFENKLKQTIDRSQGLEAALITASRAAKEQDEKIRSLRDALDAATTSTTLYERAGHAATEGLRHLTEGLESLERVGGSAGEAIGGAGRALSSLARGDVVGLATNLHRSALAFAEMSDEADRQERALAALGDGMSAVSRATADTMDETDAFRLQQRLLEAGLHTTGEELGNVAGFAREHARALGMTATQATEALTSALISGSARGLRPFGLEVDHNATRAQNWHTVLGQVATNLTQTGVSARTASEDIHRFDRELGDSVNEIGRTISAALHLRSAFSGLVDLLHAATNGGALHADNASEDQARADAQGRAVDQVARLQRTINGINTAELPRFNQLSRENAEIFERSLANAHTAGQVHTAVTELNARIGAATAAASAEATANDNDANRLGNPSAPATVSHGGGGGGRRPSQMVDMQAAAERENARQQAEEDREEDARIAENDAKQARMDGEVAAENTRLKNAAREEQSRLRREELEDIRQHNDHVNTEAKRQALALLAAQHAETNAMRNHWAEVLELHKGSNERMADFTTNAYHTMTAAFEQHLEAVMEGNETGIQALKAFTHQVSMSLGMQAGEQMVMEIAAGIGMIARAAGSYGADGGAETSAASHFASAAMYGTLAAAGFGVAYATREAPTASAGSKSGAPSAAASLGRNGAANDNGMGGGGVTYNINVNGSIVDTQGMARAVGDGLTELHGSRQLPAFMR